MEGEKKERPQNKNLKPLGSGNLTPEEEREIRRKGNAAANKARKRNADIRAAVRAVLNLNSKGRAKSMDVLKMTGVDQLQEDGAPLIAQVVYTQVLLALNGDKESRDWLVKMTGLESILQEAAQGLTLTADADALSSAGGVRIHLIRGEKPREDENEEDAATRAANRLAVVEAMRAIGESADQIGQAVADHVSEALNDSEGESPDE